MGRGGRVERNDVLSELNLLFFHLIPALQSQSLSQSQSHSCSILSLQCYVMFGLVWFGLVWFGLVWFGLVWFGFIWCYVALFVSQDKCQTVTVTVQWWKWSKSTLLTDYLADEFCNRQTKSHGHVRQLLPSCHPASFIHVFRLAPLFFVRRSIIIKSVSGGFHFISCSFFWRLNAFSVILIQFNAMQWYVMQ